ncbi:MAG: lysophospholipid acyltransferase family protein [Acidobacteriota bacterium]
MQSEFGPALDGIPDHELSSEIEAAASQTRLARSLCRDAARQADGSHADMLRRRVYAFAPLSSYSIRERLVIRVADLGFYFLIRLVCSTLRWEVRGYEHLESITGAGRRAIFTCWHSCIFSATWFWRKRGIVVMSSTSRDAEFTGRFIKRFGYGTARGSATRGSGRALAEMADCLDNGIEVAFTIDGPRGPANVAKPGAVTLARHSGQAVLPFYIAARRNVEIPSWDRLRIPLPFTRALTLIGEPIYVSREATGAEAASVQAALQSALDNLRNEGEAWRKKGGART